LIEKILDALSREVRKTLESGLSIAVVGWRDSNHSQFTRQLSACGKIIFLDASATNVPKKAGLVLFTRFVSHQEFRRLKKGKSYHAVPVDTGRIKKIFESCEDLLVPVPRIPVAIIISPIVTTESTISAPHAAQAKIDDDVLDLLTTPRRYTMDKMEKFAAIFLTEANANRKKPGYIGKMRLGKIREECEIEESNTQLVDACWLVSEVSDGRSHVGWYKAGERMLSKDHATVSEAPDDPYEWAKWRVAQKDDVLKRKAAIDAELVEIALAEKAIEQLEALRPKK
jgi:hypothetical protein